jgi:lipopolysaccharide transport system ATP-binding protein
MQEDIAIALKNISKTFKQYEKPVDRLQELLIPRKQIGTEFWALKDINLVVPKGKTLGVVGQNGSGKSTLLQIIAKTMRPTKGEVFVNGRVSALLELGCGFNPEFTGRENVFFNGTVLGLTTQEIEEKFSEIVSFAEIGDFLEQPVKTYSSGMVVRLAFAVAASIEPDILIIDEALAVGDAKFQARCMKRIRKLREEGVTILFVSHDLSAIQSFCNYAILMEGGQVIEGGNPKEIINKYIGLLSLDYETQETNTTCNHSLVQRGSYEHGNKLAQIERVLIKDYQTKSQTIYTNSLIELEIIISAKEDIKDLVVGISIRNLLGVVIYGTNTFLLNKQTLKIKTNQQLTIIFKVPCYLNKGTYTLTVGLHKDNGTSYDWIDEVDVFEVLNCKECDGIVDLHAEYEVIRNYI